MPPALRLALGPAKLDVIASWLTLILPVLVVVSPWLQGVSSFGVHDWDVETSHRYLTKVSLLEYGEAPYWNPYACGGVPAWGFVEGGTNLVSPWLVAYLTLPIALAVRIEAIGSAVIGAFGAFAAAGRFTRSHAARAFVVALWAVDSRWSLQAASGHTWHLLYAWMPWCLYFFERAREEGPRFRNTLALAGCFALLLYGGGIYPLPHVVLALALYACTLSILEKSARPLARLGLAGALALLLSAPKLLPMLHEFGRTPRLIASTETIGPRVLWLALTSRDQTMHAPVSGLPYGWHEYGLYVSVGGLVAIVIASAMVWAPRESTLRCIGLFFVVLGLGAFHPLAPWALLHAHVPLFTSEHVPSRFLYPGLLLLALAAASGVERLGSRRPWLEPVVAVAVLVLALDVALVARHSMTESMHLIVPDVSAADTFHHEEVSPFRAMPMYMAMLRKRGVIQCYGALADRIGARSVTDPRFRGEAVVQAIDSTPQVEPTPAPVVAWSPNRVVVDAGGAAPGTTLVYNMNYDDGWTSSAGPVVDVDDKVGVVLMRPEARVSFVYRPRLLLPGVLAGALGVLLAMALAWRERRVPSP